MKDHLTIEVTRTAQPEVRKLIGRTLQEFNAPFLGDHPFGTLDVLVHSAGGELVGGLVGEFAFGWFSVQVLWIEESQRGSGVGTTILKRAEDAAVEYGCHSASVETMSFQAPGFYEKHGYVRVAVIEGYPGGAQKIFMRKHLRLGAV